jgi:hypothetical protein
MKASSSNVFGMLAAGVFAVLATPATAQLSVTGNGPYYAVPSWDQKLTTNRFVILANWNNEAVLDRETGLVWERSPESTERNWIDASSSCNKRAVGGRRGWRLAGIQELASLVDPSVPSPGPTLPPAHPFLNVQGEYWSATTDAEGAQYAWTVFFGDGGVYNEFGKTTTLKVWCVRTAQGPDVQ